LKRSLLRVGLVAAATLTVVATSGVVASAHSYGTEYYLSVGDSLAVGLQPGADGVGRPTHQGYVDDVFARLRVQEARKGRHLELVELGCSGETSTTLINGGICEYPGATSQLDAAAKFLAAHRGQVRFGTVNIGSNDVESCVGANGVDTACVGAGLAALQANLPVITHALTADATFVGLTYYNPFLASWLSGPDGQALAMQSTQLLGAFNQIQVAAYTQAGYRIADVASAFRVNDFTDQVNLPGVGQVPVNVARTCELTWMCAAAPVGPNIHPNALGYALIARVVEGQL
jgi:lysophospholipase L1-like esterase